MSKKSNKKDKSKAPKEVMPAKKENLNIPHEEKPFDFGGLPQRDLKKNLGCG